MALPFLLAPVGSSRLFFPRGECVAAAEAGKAGTAYCLSTLSGCRLEEVRAATPGLPGINSISSEAAKPPESAIARARVSGFHALVVTIDTAVAGRGNAICATAAASSLAGTPLEDAPAGAQIFSRPLADRLPARRRFDAVPQRRCYPASAPWHTKTSVMRSSVRRLRGPTWSGSATPGKDHRHQRRADCRRRAPLRGRGRRRRRRFESRRASTRLRGAGAFRVPEVLAAVDGSHASIARRRHPARQRCREGVVSGRASGSHRTSLCIRPRCCGRRRRCASDRNSALGVVRTLRLLGCLAVGDLDNSYVEPLA